MTPPPPYKVGDLIEKPSPLSPVSHVGGIKFMNIWSVFCQLRALWRGRTRRGALDDSGGAVRPQEIGYIPLSRRREHPEVRGHVLSP